MLDKCYCGPVGKSSGHRLYELFAARGLVAVNQLQQDFTKDIEPLTLTPLNFFSLSPHIAVFHGDSSPFCTRFCDI